MGEIHVNIGLVTETCCHKGCGVMFAFTRGYFDEVRNDSSRWWFCPNGHTQHYTGDSDAQKLRQSQARETALQDQLAAATREAENTRVALLRDRQRFVNGICPCCERTFEDVRKHMARRHPDYDVAKVKQTEVPIFTCSCGRSFGTFNGLRIHQGRSRVEGLWDRSTTRRYDAHLTKV